MHFAPRAGIVVSEAENKKGRDLAGPASLKIPSRESC
jgi:hypothetical protein